MINNEKIKMIELQDGYMIAIDEKNKVIEIYFNYLLIDRIEYRI